MTWADDTARLLTVFWRQNASLCCICRRTPADYNSLYRFPQNLERLAVWEEKLSAVKNLYSHWCCVASRMGYFLDRKIHNNVTEIPGKFRADLTKTTRKSHISALNI